MSASKLQRVAGLGLAASLLIAGTATAQQSQNARVFGIGAPQSASELPPGAFRDALLALEPQARGRALGILQNANTPAADFAHMRVDRRGGVYYVDPEPVGEIESVPEPTLPEEITETQAFQLHSKPGASKVLYVDFDGHDLINTIWNGSRPILEALPYDLDGNPNSFSAAELTRIAESWRRVAEDFAAFDVDVTTEEPPFTIGAGGRIDYGPNVGHNLVTANKDQFGNALYSCGCGGVAYLGAFGNSYSQPGLTFNQGLGSNAMTISHETGHNLNLSHDGTSSSGYYGGHGSGETGWGPIMGAPFGDSMVTWSKGEYPDANNQEDDYAIIGNYLPLRTDDHEDVLFANATPLQVTGDVNVVSTTRVTDPGWSDLANKGVIEDPSDYDLFSMSVGAGTIDLTIEPANGENYEGDDGANLDIQARLLDSAGNVLQISNPDLDLAAAINYAVTIPGEYYLEITGVGRAGTGGTDYGHSDYDSVGQYYIAGTVPPDTVVTYPPVAPTVLTADLVGGTDIELSWIDPTTTPEEDETGYRVFRKVDSGSFALRATLPRDSEFFADNNLGNGEYSYYLEVFNSAGTDQTAATDPIVIEAPVVAVATGESTALGSIASGSYVSTQAMAGSEILSEQHSGGRPQSRVSYLDHTWTVTGVQPGAMIELKVVAEAPDNGEFDDFLFRYSVNGGSWVPLGTVERGTGETEFVVTLPGDTSGTLRVWVEDTDRTVGARNQDTVSVKLIQVTSIGDAGDMFPMVSISSPDDGIIVEGGTEVAFTGIADDSEDGDLTGSITWNSDIDGSFGSGGGANKVLSGGASAVTHVITASVTDSAGQTSTDSITVIVDDTPAATSMAITDLLGSSANGGKGGKWSATVTVAVESDLFLPVSGATVSGNWSGDARGGGSCTTGADGSCEISKGGMKSNDTTATFTVTEIAGELTYDSTANSDTSVTITAP